MSSLGQYDEDGCRGVVLSAIGFYYSERVRYDSARAAACLTSVATQLATCSGSWPLDLHACRTALPGTAKPGQPCSFDFECESSAGDPVRCSHGVCSTGASVSVTAESWGSTCVDDTDCRADCDGCSSAYSCENTTCIPSALGRSCMGALLPVAGNTPSSCVVGEACPNTSEECAYSSVTGSYSCQSVGGVGMPCRTGQTCDADLVCTSGICRETGSANNPCHADGTCEAGLAC
ncbi:MAG TPA: hypothetical protein VIV60_16715, partial [Polyangiaceae bacterium]